MARCASEALELANNVRELGTRAASPQRERCHQTHGDEVLLTAAEREDP